MYVDFHSHILPCADHGSDGIETSCKQLQNAISAGVDTIVATPHFYLDSDTTEEFLARRDRAYEELVRQELHGVTIIPAAEVTIFMGLETLEGLEKLCIGDTNYILLELPPEPWSVWIQETVYKIAALRHLRPICAHIDRYSPSGCEKMLNMGANIQLNAEALLTNLRTRQRFESLISEGCIHVLGSDAHGDGEAAYKNFAHAMKRLGSMAEQLTNNARKILSGDFID